MHFCFHCFWYQIGCNAICSHKRKTFKVYDLPLHILQDTFQGCIQVWLHHPSLHSYISCTSCCHWSRSRQSFKHLLQIVRFSWNCLTWRTVLLSLQAVFLYSEQQTPGVTISSKTYLNWSFFIWRLSHFSTEQEDSGGLSGKVWVNIGYNQNTINHLTRTVLCWFPGIAFTTSA